MAVPVVMPKLGNTVESSIIVEWRKKIGDTIAEGEPLCDVETDKATVEVASPASGTLLAVFFDQGADVPVMTHIAAIGAPGEDVSALRPGGTESEQLPVTSEQLTVNSEQSNTGPALERGTESGEAAQFVGVSPRARNLAARKELDVARLQGSGPGGRIIERDVQAALSSRPKVSPVAQARLAEGGYAAPDRGSGPGGRIMAKDLRKVEAEAEAKVEVEAKAEEDKGEVEVVKVVGVRRVIAERMLQSMQTTAQLTLNASADARGLLAFRKRLKASPEALGLQSVTINDLILLAVARTLPQHPDLNAHFGGDTITRYKAVHLGVAVDTPRGLVVPVIRNAQRLSLKQISQEAKRLATAALERRIGPDELTGGTFTVTNLGSLGIESFTPVLNPPEVAILGVGNVNLKAVEIASPQTARNDHDAPNVQFIPHLGLSLTINHQVVDGAPGARFLQALAQALANVDLLTAL